MQKSENGEQGASGEAVDYSRPVGWWIRRHAHTIIPVYLPIPEGQRPPAASEVEDAEVVTYTIPGTSDPAWSAPPGWTTFSDTAEEIYDIVVGINKWANGTGAIE